MKTYLATLEYDFGNIPGEGLQELYEAEFETEEQIIIFVKEFLRFPSGATLNIGIRDRQDCTQEATEHE